MSTQTIIDTWMVDLKADLIKEYSALGLRASGNWAEQLEETSKPTSSGYKAIMLGEQYTGAITDGRSANADQSPEALKAWAGWAGSTFIKDWVENKGLDLSPYAVAYNIAKNGWSVPNNHNAGGLLSNVITKDRLAGLIKQISKDYETTLISELTNTLKNVN